MFDFRNQLRNKIEDYKTQWKYWWNGRMFCIYQRKIVEVNYFINVHTKSNWSCLIQQGWNNLHQLAKICERVFHLVV